MAWTYTDSPQTEPRDEVRLLVGDTDSTAPLPLTDAAVAYHLANAGGSALGAAAAAAAQLAGHYARQVDTSNGALSVGASKRAEAFRALAATLARRASVAGMSRGMLISADQPPAQFEIGQDDLPGSARSLADTEVA